MDGLDNFDWLSRFLEDNEETFIESVEETPSLEEEDTTYMEDESEDDGDETSDEDMSKFIQEECDFSYMATAGGFFEEDSDDEETDIYEEETDEDSLKSKSFREKTKARLKKICDTIIQKIKEMVAAIKLKVSEISFANEIRKIKKAKIKQINAASYDKELKAIATTVIRGYADFIQKIFTIYNQCAKGKLSEEVGMARMDALEERYTNELSKVVSKLDMLDPNSLKKTAGAISVLKTIESYQDLVDSLADEFAQKSNKTSAIFSAVSNTPITGNTPENVAAVANKAAGATSRAYTKTSGIIGKIIGFAKAYGADICKMVAAAGVMGAGVQMVMSHSDDSMMLGGTGKVDRLAGLGVVTAGGLGLKKAAEGIEKTRNERKAKNIVTEEAEDFDVSDFDQTIYDIVYG